MDYYLARTETALERPQGWLHEVPEVSVWQQSGIQLLPSSVMAVAMAGLLLCTHKTGAL
jgi:hypothetical protein